MKYIILFTLFVIAGFVISLFVRLGAFRDVKIVTADEGPLRVIYKVHIGAYHKIVPVIQEVETWAKAHGEPCRLSFGEYLDDPANSVEDRMHSNGGCLVDKSWSQADLPADFVYREIPARAYVKAEFDGAPSIGPLKVYPRVKKFLKEKGLAPDGAVIEMYEILPGDKVTTRYLFPVSK